MKQLIAQLLKTDANQWSASKVGLLGTALAAPVGGGCMCAAFIFRTFVDHQPPDFAQLGIGIGALAGGAGAGSWLHGKIA